MRVTCVYERWNKATKEYDTFTATGKVIYKYVNNGWPMFAVRTDSGEVVVAKVEGCRIHRKWWEWIFDNCI